MTSPYQSDVVCYRQDIPFDLPTSRIKITSIDNQARYRWVVQGLYGGEGASSHAYTQAEMLTALSDGSGGLYDSGWYYAATTGSTWEAWWAAQGLSVPSESVGPVSVPITITSGRILTGIRVYVFSHYGTWDVHPQNLEFQVVDPGTNTLTPIDLSYYKNASGAIYRPSWATAFGLPSITADTVLLSTIISRICVRGGLTTDDIDVSALSGIDVIGYPIARTANATDCLGPLLAAYFAYGSEYDLKLNFRPYGEDASITIDRADLLEGNDANSGNIISNLRNQATEFPRRMFGSYTDPAQNYNIVTTAPAERRSADVIAIGDQTFQIPVTMSATDAVQAVDKALKVAYATLEGTQEYSVPFARSADYLTLCVGEPVIFQGKRWVLDEIILSTGYLKLTARYDRQSAYTSAVQPILGNDPTPPNSPYSGFTVIVAMNLPSLRPQDTYGLYLAAGPLDPSSNWRGCTVQVSFDGMTSWQTLATITDRSIIGTMALDEPSGGEPLTVAVDGVLETVTDAQIAARANAFAVIGSDGVAEIGQFKTATEISGGDYELTDTYRGLIGTTEVARSLGEQFVMLESVYFLPIDISFAGQTLYLRAIGFGEETGDAGIVSVVYNPDTTVILDGGGA